jgi:hypothetical protein
MRFLDLDSAGSSRVHGGRTRWLRRLGAPAIGLLLISLTLGVAPSTAHAKTRTLVVAPSSGKVATLAKSRTNSQTTVNLKVPSSLPFFAAIQLRSPNAGAGYRAKVSIDVSGHVRVSLSRVAGGIETALGTSEDTRITTKPGKTIRLQGAIAGSNPVMISVRAWKAGSKTPKWQFGAFDGDVARITRAGKTRLWGYLPSTAAGSARVKFSKVTTSKTTVKKVRAYKVSRWVSIGSPAAAAATTPTSSSGKPSAATTGVKSGTTLTRHDGDITVTTDGTVLSNLDIHGFVTVRAKNVRITNCIVRGGKSKGVATGLITNYGFAGLVITDTDVIPEFPSVYFDGIKGSDFTAARVHVRGGVDSVKIHGSNVTITDSLLENTTYYSSDPQQGGGPTHNDNIQTLYGTNLKVIGNTIRGAQNFAILGGATRGNLNLVVQDNWLDGGHCTVKLQILNGYAETAKVTGNKFGPNRAVSSCAFTAYPAVSLTQSSNTFELTGAAVKPLVTVS